MNHVENTPGNDGLPEKKHSPAAAPEHPAQPPWPIIFDEPFQRDQLEEPVSFLSSGIVGRRVLIWIGAGGFSIGLWIMLVYWLKRG